MMDDMEVEKPPPNQAENTDSNGKGKGNKSFWHIDKDMLPFKIHFFLFEGGMGAVLPYHSALGITRLRLTPSNLAAAFTSQQIFSFFFRTAVGYIADYFNTLKAVIVGLTITQAICYLCMIVIPPLNYQANLHELQYNLSFTDPNLCSLCNDYKEYDAMLTKLPFNESILKEAIHCFNHSVNEIDYAVMHCSQGNTSNSPSTSINYQILQKTCNRIFDHNILSTNDFASSLYINKFFMISLTINNTQKNYIICDFSVYEYLNFSEINCTFQLSEKYCYSINKSNSDSIEKLLPVQSLTPRILNCEISKLKNLSLEKDEQTEALSSMNFKTYQFWLYTLCLISACSCISALFTLSDTACYESVHETGSDYGRQRVWGAVSWGIVAPFAGFLNDYTDSYVASCCLMALFCLLLIWNLSKMSLIKPDFSQNILKDIKVVFSSIEFIAFEIGIFMNGMFTGVVWSYLTWFIISIGGGKLQIGLAHTVECFVGELPFMFYSGWFIKKLGHFNIVSLALFTHGVRFLCYSYLYNPWWILPIESLHGITFGVFYPAMTSYGKINSKPGTEATTQAVLCTTYETLGAGSGCLLSGVCFDRFGGHTTFFYAAFICVLATCINILFTCITACRKGQLNITKKVTIDAVRY